MTTDALITEASLNLEAAARTAADNYITQFIGQSSPLPNYGAAGGGIVPNGENLQNAIIDILNKLIPAGSIIAVTTSQAPVGYLKANGSAISRTAYSRLFSAIGTTYGAGDGVNTFALPDLRGVFLRGLDDGRGLDANRVLSNSPQSDAVQIPTPTNASAGGNFIALFVSTTATPNYTFGRVDAINDLVEYIPQPQPAPPVPVGFTVGNFGYDGAGNHGASISRGIQNYASETRPVNMAVTLCIKY